MADEVANDGTSIEAAIDYNRLRLLHPVKVVNSQMTGNFEKDAIEVALLAVERHKQLKDIAGFMKHEYDRKYPGSGKATEGVYHCIVGKSFASAVSHETRQYIHLKVDGYNVILWKSKDSPFHVNEA